MTNPVKCRVCGVVLPERVGRCPSCGARMSRGRAPIWIGFAVAGLAAVVMGAGMLRRPRLDPALKGDVHTSTIAFRLAANQAQTEVTASVDNDSKVPVDVIVRVRAYDHGDNVVADIETKPIRNVVPGNSRPVRATLDLTPVKSVSVDIVEVSPSQP